MYDVSIISLTSHYSSKEKEKHVTFIPRLRDADLDFHTHSKINYVELDQDPNPLNLECICRSKLESKRI